MNKQKIQFDTTNKEQMHAYELIAHTNSSFFLTGRAGTGKTTFLNNIQNEVQDKNFITLAPTGVSAILAKGETIHSFFGLPIEVCTPDTVGSMRQRNIKILYHADTIIIDEISMTRCDVVDAIDNTIRYYMRSNRAFGGKQVVFVGDMFQLAPVVTAQDRHILSSIYKTDQYYFYNANVFKRFRLVTIELKKVYRQEDKTFLNILNEVRRSCLPKTTLRTDGLMGHWPISPR